MMSEQLRTPAMFFDILLQVDEWKGQEEREGRNTGRNRGRWESEYESGRNCESECNEDERNLVRRREVLMGQLEEARWLKLNIEKRSKKVSSSTSAFSPVKVEDVGFSFHSHPSEKKVRVSTFSSIRVLLISEIAQQK